MDRSRIILDALDRAARAVRDGDVDGLECILRDVPEVVGARDTEGHTLLGLTRTESPRRRGCWITEQTRTCATTLAGKTTARGQSRCIWQPSTAV